MKKMIQSSIRQTPKQRINAWGAHRLGEKNFHAQDEKTPASHSYLPKRTCAASPSSLPPHLSSDPCVPIAHPPNEGKTSFSYKRFAVGLRVGLCEKHNEFVIDHKTDDSVLQLCIVDNCEQSRSDLDGRRHGETICQCCAKEAARLVPQAL